jgi:trans-2,3-dihydro-3-hydroxyanthranilate isomerase
MTAMRTFRYVLCDVFTDRPLTGNPLAVFTDGRGLDSETQQAIAREMNLSETVFVFPAESGGQAKIRIFSPKVEMPFAGHPTLGSAFVLAGPMQSNEIRLETGIGVINVRLEREGPRVVFGWMDQPVPQIQRFAREQELLAALGLGAAALPIDEYDNGPRHAIVIVDDPAAVDALAPDLGRLAELPYTISVAAGSGTRWATRVFAPGLGVAEDPATGSAAGPLAVHLARHGRIQFGEHIYITQGKSLGRPSELVASAHGSAGELNRVEVGGAAVVIGRGELRI